MKTNYCIPIFSFENLMLFLTVTKCMFFAQWTFLIIEDILPQKKEYFR